jgi:hypothetical protein
VVQQGGGIAHPRMMPDARSRCNIVAFDTGAARIPE